MPQADQEASQRAHTHTYPAQVGMQRSAESKPNLFLALCGTDGVPVPAAREGGAGHAQPFGRDYADPCGPRSSMIVVSKF